MNDLREAYSYYCSIDQLLKLLNEKKEKRVNRSYLKKGPYWKTVIELTLLNDLILLSGDTKRQQVVLTDKGKEHLQGGGFEKTFYLKPKESPQKTFKEHLDDLTGLITIFGILNAVTIFASQIKIDNNPNNANVLNLDLTGVQFVSISMYVLSLVVLWEIIWVTAKEGSGNVKFKLLYFLLCMTALGIGLLFLSQFKDAIYAACVILAFFGLILIISAINLKLFALLITPGNARWVKKNVTNLTSILIIISIIMSGLILKLIMRLLINFR